MSLVVIVAVALLSSCIGSSAAFDSTCGNKPARFIVVDQTGQGFQTVQSAIDSVPEQNYQWTKIKISRGVYVEQVTIPYNKPCIILEGEGQDLTEISFNAHQATDTSSTLTSYPPYTVFRRITFTNTYNHIYLRLRPDLSSDIKQAVAVRVLGDKSAFFDCGFVGLQDTLWDVQGRHYFKNCYIEGAIDFIFGYGQSVYEDCRVNSTAGALSSQLEYGYITAQGRENSANPSGFVFLRGSVTGTTKAYLGRAYGPFSRVIFIGTTFGSIVMPQGWDSWSYQGHERGITYAEVDCHGSGADTSRRVPWVEKFDAADAKHLFSINSFINQDRWIDNIPS
ncbi:PREDICTED: putative pectinesterase 52 [Tarenaya hassleriana]|uniref:putative pectinesterase 52 n=1 Tax=Tarenaya hassleriana TaxID=28532 RepID=UPI0008FD0FD8|nr:PREDICTED: putative pectinesterase 52 [Tarenaya hassleriana]